MVYRDAPLLQLIQKSLTFEHEALAKLLHADEETRHVAVLLSDSVYQHVDARVRAVRVAAGLHLSVEVGVEQIDPFVYIVHEVLDALRIVHVLASDVV